jgi:hypothetical protein
MQFVIPINEFNDRCIHFNHRTENTVVSGGGFHKTLYCTSHATLIGIPVSFSVKLNDSDDSFTHVSSTSGSKNNHTSGLYSECEEAVLTIVISLLNRIHKAWSCSTAHKRPLSLGPTISLVRQAISRAFERYEPTPGSTYHFVFKCSGLFDTEHDSGITFRLLAVRGEELNNDLHHSGENQVEECQNHSN